MKSGFSIITLAIVSLFAVALPWAAHWRPWWAPAVLGILILGWMVAPARRPTEPWSGLVVALSCAIFLLSTAGWQTAGGWLLLAAAVGVVARFQPRRLGRGRPDAADLVALVGWATVPLVDPQIMQADRGGWLAPAILLLACRRSLISLRGQPEQAHREPVPPSRPARGTVSLRGVVLAAEGLARSVPIDLELRAGDSLAVLCDNAVDAEALCEVLAGRRPPLKGELAIDAVPFEAEDRLVTVVGPGERFLRGGIHLNLGALCEDEPEPTTLAAVGEACSIDEVAQALGDAMVDELGAPLSAHHRLLLLTGRVVPSEYRVLIVADPVCWLNAVHGELWRAAVVRASIARTAVWITTDRDLASRACQVMQLRHGALRPFDGLGKENS